MTRLVPITIEALHHWRLHRGSIAFAVHYAALMDNSSSALSVAIGIRVKEQRRARGWTLDQLAEAASLSRRMLVNVEQGAANPSVGTLLRLSEALGIGLPELVDAPRAATTTLTRSGNGAVLWSGTHGGRGVLVASATTPAAFELWDWRLEPGDEHRSEAHSGGTRELLQVIEGAITLHVGDDEHLLAAGDAIGFPGDISHAYAAAGDAAARFALTVLEPAARPAGAMTHRG